MPLSAAVLTLWGPATAASLKIAAYEYLPAVSSASLAAILVRLAWRQVPEWIRNDVSFQSSPKQPQLQQQEQQLNRLSHVVEKWQRGMEAASSKLKAPVPHLYFSLLAYLQLASQLKRELVSERNALYHQPQSSQLDMTNSKNPNMDPQVLRQALDWAVLAYYVDKGDDFIQNKLQQLQGNFQLLHRIVSKEPGSIGLFMAANTDTNTNNDNPNKSDNTLLIALKGTSKLEDIITDSCARSVSYHGHLDRDEEVMSRIEVTSCDDFIPSRESITFEGSGIEVTSCNDSVPAQESITFEGSNHALEDEFSHVRCHEGILIAVQRVVQQVLPVVEQLVIQGNHCLEITGHSLGGSAAALLGLLLRERFPLLSSDTNRDRLQVFAFGPPPVLDHDSAIAASSYTISVVNNADLIARSSLINLSVFLECLRVISLRLNERGLAPTGPRSFAALVAHLSKGDDVAPILTKAEWTEAMQTAVQQVELRHPLHLYVPGRVLLLYQPWCEDDNNNKSNLDYQCTQCNGSAPALRFLELDGLRMIGDHTTACYSSSLEACFPTTETCNSNS